MKKFGQVWLETRGQTVLVVWEDERGEWVVPFDVCPQNAPLPIPKGLSPLKWSAEVEEKVIRWAGYWAGEFRMQDEVRDDLVSECLIKAHRKVKEGAIYRVGALNTLCKRKGLDLLRKITRRSGRECEMPEKFEPEGFDQDLTFTEQVKREFYLLYAAAEVLAEGGTMEDAAERVRVDPEHFTEWLEGEREKARKKYGL